MKRSTRLFNLAMTLAIVLPLIWASWWSDLSILSIGYATAFMIGLVLETVIFLIGTSPWIWSSLDSDAPADIFLTATPLCLCGAFASLASFMWTIYLPLAIASSILAFAFGFLTFAAFVLSLKEDTGKRAILLIGIFAKN
jgi:hypothetical protein